MEYVTESEIVYCNCCGCIIPAGTLVDTSDPCCTGCECRAK